MLAPLGGGTSISAPRESKAMDFVEQNFKRQTTYREYTLKFLCDGDGKLPERFEERIAAREAQIAAKMQPGDELWEYEHGDWNAFAAVSGLAIVRDGKVIESWWEWKA